MQNRLSSKTKVICSHVGVKGQSRAGAVAGSYRTGRFTKAPHRQTPARPHSNRPQLRAALAPRHPGAHARRRRTPQARTAGPRMPGTHRGAGAVFPARRPDRARHPRDKTFSEKVGTRVRVRPQFVPALALAREIKAHAILEGLDAALDFRSFRRVARAGVSACVRPLGPWRRS